MAVDGRRNEEDMLVRAWVTARKKMWRSCLWAS